MKTTIHRWIIALLCITSVMPREVAAIPDNMVTLIAAATFGVYSYRHYKKVSKKMRALQQERAEVLKRPELALIKPSYKKIIQKMLDSWRYSGALVLCGGLIVADQIGFFRTNNSAAGGTPQTPLRTGNNQPHARTQAPRAPVNSNEILNTGEDALLAQALALSLAEQDSSRAVPEVDLAADEAYARSLEEEDENQVQPVIASTTPDLTNLSFEEQIARVEELSRLEEIRTTRAQQDAEYQEAMRIDLENRARAAEEARLRAEEAARQTSEQAEKERLAAEKMAQEETEAEAQLYRAAAGIVCSGDDKKAFNNGDPIHECSGCKKIVCQKCRSAHGFGLRLKDDSMKQKCPSGIPCTFIDKTVVFAAERTNHASL